MNYQVVKQILGGLILGAILFFFPFFAVKVVGFLLIIATIFWLFRGRRSHWRQYAMLHPDKIRSMSDEEYESFKSYFGRSHCYNYHEGRDKTNEKANHEK
jgi:UPF0716 family protein affecting phage T7 exclusion